MSALIIFGQAVSSSSPNDIDVACERPLTNEDVAKVRAWAKQQHGWLGSQLAINAHVVLKEKDGVLKFNSRQEYYVLSGSVFVVRQ